MSFNAYAQIFATRFLSPENYQFYSQGNCATQKSRSDTKPFFTFILSMSTWNSARRFADQNWNDATRFVDYFVANWKLTCWFYLVKFRTELSEFYSRFFQKVAWSQVGFVAVYRKRSLRIAVLGDVIFVRCTANSVSGLVQASTTVWCYSSMTVKA